MTTPLYDRLLARINATGPLSVAEYMTECLLHPEHGYYTTREPFGRAGDFVTAPEISQMFGELLGLFLAQSWLDQGAPTPFALAELGPGRGTLMADILRATRAVPGFHDAMRLSLVEASPRLRAIQGETLRPHAPEWVENLDDLPDLPLFLVANEFFDALPVRQFLREGSGWRERRIGAEAGAGLYFGAGPATPVDALTGRLADTVDGNMVELSLPAQALAGALATRIAADGGVALIVDYGGPRSHGDTLQAIYNGAPDDPLVHPGEADLTAHVDFGALADAALPHCAVTPLTPQGTLLERLGIAARAERLARSLDGAALTEHLAAFRRLTHPDEMGTLFKAIALHPNNAPTPPGFSA